MTEAPLARRIERGLAQLGSEHDPPPGWEMRVLAAIRRERLEGELVRLGEDHEPAPGWQDRVLAATTARRKRRWWAVAAPATAAMAAIVIYFAVPSNGSAAPGLAIRRIAGRQPVQRSSNEDNFEVGDTLRATVDGKARNRALWIYREDRHLVADCPRDPRCRISENEVTIEIVVEIVGRYRVVSLVSESTIPSPHGLYDQDLATAMDAGARATDELRYVY